MRFLWISFLLVGGVTCAPQKPGDEGEAPMWWYVASSSQQEPSQPVYQSPSGQVSGSGVYSSYPGVQYYSGAGGADSGSTYGSQQSSQQEAAGDGGHYQSAEESWSSSSEPSGEEELSFTPVDEDDQVYAYKSKSRYNRKQLRFSQFRYTPTEPLVYQEPVHPYPKGKPHHHHHHPGQKGY